MSKESILIVFKYKDSVEVKPCTGAAQHEGGGQTKLLGCPVEKEWPKAQFCSWQEGQAVFKEEEEDPCCLASVPYCRVKLDSVLAS
ncbi:hypothetical protein INR49_023783 [Caranx melampygus]|nr:hypothetical protein INR49_023783 [Caranx melampygus]